MIYSKEQFKKLWESNDNGGGITFDDIADCAKSWNLIKHPRKCPIKYVVDLVLSAANISE